MTNSNNLIVLPSNTHPVEIPAADGYLWTRLVHGRIEHMDNWRRMAFEIGFLTRLQQRLGRMPE